MSVRARTTFLLHRSHLRISRHDFRSPIGVTGVGRAVYGNSGISFGQSHWSGPDDDQTRQPQSVHQMFGADAGELQFDMSGIPSSPCVMSRKTGAISASDSS
jgi:hypothetical protein